MAKMEELLQCGDFVSLALICEQEELQAAGGIPSPQIYGTLLAVYLLQNELDHAKLLWQRIPSEVKQSNGELGELWEIGKRLWRRDFSGVYELAKNPSWPPHIAPIVSNLVVQLRQRVVVLIGKAYKTIKLSNLCALLGLSETEVKQLASEKEWELDSQSNVFKPKPPQALEGTALQEHQERLQRLTDIISFLEN